MATICARVTATSQRKRFDPSRFQSLNVVMSSKQSQLPSQDDSSIILVTRSIEDFQKSKKRRSMIIIKMITKRLVFCTNLTGPATVHHQFQEMLWVFLKHSNKVPKNSANFEEQQGSSVHCSPSVVYFHHSTRTTMEFFICFTTQWRFRCSVCCLAKILFCLFNISIDIY